MATITVTRKGGSAGAIAVGFATRDGTAQAGVDYTAVSGTLTFADGDTAPKSFTVPITEDTTVEANETVNLTLSAPIGGATLGARSTALLTLVDDVTPPPLPAGTVQFSAPGYSAQEEAGRAVITVTRSSGSAGAISVNFATEDGPAPTGAQAGVDYTATSGILTFAEGDTAPKTFSVPILRDTAVEPNETVTLTLSAPTGGALLGTPSHAVVTLVDTDGAPPDGDGGGCTLGSTDTSDPTFPVLLLCSLLYLRRRFNVARFSTKAHSVHRTEQV